MEHPELLLTPVLALTSALVGAFLAARLGQSVVLGYILAGVVIGPFTPGPVGDAAAVRAIADVGIVLLMFAIGVEISLRELLGAGKIAIFGAPVQVAGSLAVGTLAARAVGIPEQESLFFGGAVAISSTALLTKMLSDLGQGGSDHGRLALSWSAVQDLLVVALVVVLSAIAAPGERMLSDALVAVAKAAAFLGVIAPVASMFFPRLLERIALLRNREVFILTIAAVALGTAYVSSLLGLSLALGAFVAGLVVGESELSEHILGEVGPLRDVFAGLFFVSIGMLIDPWFVLAQWPLVLLTLAVVVVPKALLVSGVLVVGRVPISTSVLTAVLLSNSGEFSFILAEIGVDLGGLSPAAFNALLAGAAASMLVSPLLARGALPALRWVERRVGKRGGSLEPEPGEQLGRYAVICGYGRVGHVVGEALLQRGFGFVVVEQDPRVVRRLRSEGVPAIAGNAGNPRVLERVGLELAGILVVAVPDPLAARQIVDFAQRVNPRLDIVVRTHTPAEAAYMRRRGVAEAVIGEHELALELTRHTLHRYGLSNLEILAITRGLRERLLEEG